MFEILSALFGTILERILPIRDNKLEYPHVVVTSQGGGLGVLEVGLRNDGRTAALNVKFYFPGAEVRTIQSIPPDRDNHFAVMFNDSEVRSMTENQRIARLEYETTHGKKLKSEAWRVIQDVGDPSGRRFRIDT